MTDDPLVGRWRLLSCVGRSDDGSLTFPLGRDPQGSLVYTQGGWMSAQVCAGSRMALPTEDVRSGSEAQRAEAFSSYVAYCGSYEIRGDTVIHRVVMSLFPNWVGTDQTRAFVITGEELLLRTPPIEVGGTSLVYEFLWRREEV